ncbi:MAG: hypothetical protein SOH81_06340 [Acetobacter sp.]|jgi:hypothetical protein|nr:hypothetical protein [Acetobacter sp.]
MNNSSSAWRNRPGVGFSDTGPRFTIGTLLWAVLYFLFYVMQQLAELLAPLALIIGIGWSVLPKLVDAISSGIGSTDPQTQEAVAHVGNIIPKELVISGHVMTASGLIGDGIMLIVLAALGATLSAVAARSM